MSRMNDALADLVDAFARLPGIGRKTAQRLAFHIIEAPAEEAELFAKALRHARQHIHHCRICGNLTDGDICHICANHERANGIICVVEEVRDISALERTGAFFGRYHVLGGRLSPMDGIRSEDLNIENLMRRLESEDVREVILATNPSVEGEATALYLAEILHEQSCRVTRIAQGLPMGADIKYADDLTLARALASRVDV